MLAKHSFSEEWHVFFFDFIQGERSSFIAYVANDVVLHRTKLEKADAFYQKHVGGLLQPPRPDELADFRS